MSDRYRKRLTDEQRFILADDNADMGVAISNALAIKDHDGNNTLERIRASLAGHTGATDYDRPAVKTSTTSDPTPSSAHALAEHGDEAASDLDELDTLLKRQNADSNRVCSILGKYLTRPPSRTEAISTAVEEAGKDAGCKSCARLTTHGGAKFFSPTYRTSDVRKDIKKSDTARLASSCGLCERCYDYIVDTVKPGMKLRLDQAIPRKVVRAFMEGRRVYRPAS